jgi:eukaryotic-like serine/threonine-protein kinase
LRRDGLATRFTFGTGLDRNPVWSPDGKQIVYTSDPNGPPDLFQKVSSGVGDERALLPDRGTRNPTSWSADGRFLLFNTPGQTTGADVWVLPMSGTDKPFPFLQTRANEGAAQFSPEGKWIAYVSNESGRPEVYVAPFDGSSGTAGSKWQVSTNGGNAPRWRPDGREIFYLSPIPNQTLMAATVSPQGEGFNVGVVAPLFPLRPSGTLGSVYQVSPDGKRFLVNMAPLVEAAPTPITVVVNWTAGVKR